VRLATWNVNGVRARFEELVAWVGEARPEVLCLQEIKAAPEQIPEGLFALADYHTVWHGNAKGRNGVSIHVHKDLLRDAPDFEAPPFDVDQRAMTATLGGLTVASVYVPNGGADYEGKLHFLEALGAWCADRRAQGRPLLVCGDLNVTRGDVDLHPKERKPGAIGQREDERTRFEAVLGHGLDDVLRTYFGDDDDTVFTWWAPWRNHRQKNRGWRIDYVLASPELAPGVKRVEVLREMGRSDHGAVVVDLELPPGMLG